MTVNGGESLTAIAGLLESLSAVYIWTRACSQQLQQCLCSSRTKFIDPVKIWSWSESIISTCVKLSTMFNNFFYK